MHNNVAGRPWDGPPGPHFLYVGLVYSPPFDYGRDLWLRPNQKTTAKVQGITSMITIPRILTSILLPYSRFWLGCSKFSHWEDTCGEELRASSGRQPFRNSGPHSNRPKGKEICQHHVNLEIDHAPVTPWLQGHERTRQWKLSYAWLWPIKVGSYKLLNLYCFVTQR